jgi:phospholipid/cholesterol/gamma-HCH transport system permease protein
MDKVAEQETTLILPESLDIPQARQLWLDLKKSPATNSILLDFSQLKTLGSAGAGLIRLIQKRFSSTRLLNLSPEIQSLLSLLQPEALSPPQATEKKQHASLLFSLGERGSQMLGRGWDLTRLVADTLFHSLVHPFSPKGVQKGDVTQQLFLMGYKSLFITSVISLLVGLTISMTTAAQLHLLGGDIYLPSIVGFAMIKELIPLMTGIILAGKIGASITAEISTMKIMEEIDALQTMGIDPVRYLMVPRMLAMTLAMPLLLTCANVVGISACLLVGHIYSAIPPQLFIREMLTILTLDDILLAGLKTLVFGWAVVLTSGFFGLRAANGAAGVGEATTRSVLASISSIIVINCLFAVAVYF